MPSVFISSTSKDLGDYRAAVKAAIERLDLRAIDMRNFGAQPGGAVGVSVREVGKADIFVGILAKRYGYVPEGMTKSVTEQEYDEAIRLKLPRLMYLLDENFVWDAALIEDGETTQARLKAFKDRVNANEVRSLFTSKEDLAAQVTADLSKLISRQRRRRRALSLLVAAAAAIILLMMAFLLIPDFHDAVVKPIENLTAKPFDHGETGIVFANFEVIDAGTPNTEQNIQQKLDEDGVHYVHVDYRVLGGEQGRAQARAIAAHYNATIVIWGQVANGGVRYFFEINAPPEHVEIDIPLIDISVAEMGTNLEIFIFKGMDILYGVDFIRGQIAYHENDYDSALTFFKSAADYIPASKQNDVETAALYFYRGNSFYQLGGLDKADQDYTKAIQLQSESAEAYYNRGTIRALTNQLQQAEADFTSALKIAPGYGEAYGNRGVIYNALGNTEKALEDYDTAIRLLPDYEIPYYNRGNIYRTQERYDLAIADYTSAINIRSDYEAAYINRGLAYDGQDQYDKAIADYSSAIALRSDDPIVFINRGVAYSSIGRNDLALADYNQAIALDPNEGMAFVNRGELYRSEGDYDKALVDLDHAQELQSDLVGIYSVRGLTHYLRGDYEKAIADYLTYQDLTGYLTPDQQEEIAEMEAALMATPSATETPSS